MRATTCIVCRAQVEISSLSRGPAYCPACARSRRRQSVERANKKARAKRLQAFNKPPAIRTVLVVEDDPLVRRLIVHTLQKKDYTVLETETAETALAVFLSNREAVDLTIVDMLLPGMSGLDLAAELERQQPGLNILYTSGCVTSLAIESIAMRCPELLLPKPFIPSMLIDKVSRLLAAVPHGVNVAKDLRSC